LLQSEKRHILKALTICGHLVFGPPYDGGRTLLGFYPAGEGHFWAGIGPPPVLAQLQKTSWNSYITIDR